MAYCSSYYLYQKYEKRGDQDWIPSYPNVYSIDGEGSKPLRARKMYDTDCGWIPETEPIYRWTEIAPTSDPNSYWCDDCSSEYSGQYLTFVAIDSGTFTFSGSSSSTIDNSSIEYSLNSGSTWNTLTRGNSLSVTAGQKVYFKSTTLAPVGYVVRIVGPGIGTFSSTCRYNVEGNAMSLFYGDNFQNQTSLIEKDYAFIGLFSGSTGLTSAENLVLPAINLSSGCYGSMFAGCTSLTTPPNLPARRMRSACYSGMFKGCTSLTTAPELPSTGLHFGCYSYMFSGCTSLTTAPELPTTEIAQDESMCYEEMFAGCASLTYVKCLATYIGDDDCIRNWLKDVSPTGTFVKASSMNNWPTGSSGIPSGWTVQNA